MPTPFPAELVTPERVLFSGEVEEVSLRTDDGEIAFLAHHEDFIGAVDITVCRLDVAGEHVEPLLAAVHGGFVQVDEAGVKILASVAELGAEVDVARAREALGRAEAGQGGEGTGEPTEEEAAALSEGVALSPAMLALLDPDAPAQAARRARARLEAAGASPQA